MNHIPLDDWFSFGWYFLLGLLIAYSILQITDPKKRKRVLYFAIGFSLVRALFILIKD